MTRERRLELVATAQRKLIEGALDILSSYVEPGRRSATKTVDRLLMHFDSPRGRRIERAYGRAKRR